jgi:hypothetical protein
MARGILNEVKINIETKLWTSLKVLMIICINMGFCAMKAQAESSKKETGGYPLKEINFPIAEIEAYHNQTIKTGLATLLSPYSAITARHIVSESSRSVIKLGSQKRVVKLLNELRDLNNKESMDSKMDALANDIIIVSWQSPLTINENTIFPKLSTTPPKKSQKVFIPKFKDTEITWEERHISGLDSHCSWTGLPKPLYKGVLWLNGEKINEGTPFKIGDSGGGWINEEGEVIAVTSRVDNTDLSPHKQTAYGANVIVNGNFEKINNKKSAIAYRPMLIATCILIIVWLLSQMRNLYAKKY